MAYSPWFVWRRTDIVVPGNGAPQVGRLMELQAYMNGDQDAAASRMGPPLRSPADFGEALAAAKAAAAAAAGASGSALASAGAALSPAEHLLQCPGHKITRRRTRRPSRAKGTKVSFKDISIATSCTTSRAWLPGPEWRDEYVLSAVL